MQWLKKFSRWFCQLGYYEVKRSLEFSKSHMRFLLENDRYKILNDCAKIPVANEFIFTLFEKTFLEIAALEECIVFLKRDLQNLPQTQDKVDLIKMSSLEKSVGDLEDMNKKLNYRIKKMKSKDHQGKKV